MLSSPALKPLPVSQDRLSDMTCSELSQSNDGDTLSTVDSSSTDEDDDDNIDNNEPPAAKYPFAPDELDDLESWWRDHYDWLKERGYMLRPRFAPGWKPSWVILDEKGELKKLKSWTRCEDGRPLSVSIYLIMISMWHFDNTYARSKSGSAMCDAVRESDGSYVMLKSVNPSTHPYEAEIGTFYSTEPLASDPKNHCIPIYDVLKLPDEDDTILLVMPLMRQCANPPFQTFGEAVDFFGQLFEVCEYVLGRL